MHEYRVYFIPKKVFAEIKKEFQRKNPYRKLLAIPKNLSNSSPIRKKALRLQDTLWEDVLVKTANVLQTDHYTHIEASHESTVKKYILNVYTPTGKLREEIVELIIILSHIRIKRHIRGLQQPLSVFLRAANSQISHSSERKQLNRTSNVYLIDEFGTPYTDINGYIYGIHPNFFLQLKLEFTKKNFFRKSIAIPQKHALSTEFKNQLLELQNHLWEDAKLQAYHHFKILDNHFIEQTYTKQIEHYILNLYVPTPTLLRQITLAIEQLILKKLEYFDWVCSKNKELIIGDLNKKIKYSLESQYLTKNCPLYLTDNEGNLYATIHLTP